MKSVRSVTPVITPNSKPTKTATKIPDEERDRPTMKESFPAFFINIVNSSRKCKELISQSL